MNETIKGKKIFITGAGYLARHLVERWHNDCEITIYSRGENNQESISRRFPRVKCIMGDVADYPKMLRSARGCQIGVFTAATKCIHKIDQNPEEAIKSIVTGGINSRLVAEELAFEAGVLLSTDKEVEPTTNYGLLKRVASNNFLFKAWGTPRLTVVRYGNILASDKSLLQVLPEYVKAKTPICLYDIDMTRYFLNINQAIKTIEYAIVSRQNGNIILPDLKSFKIKDIFDIYAEKFDLKYTMGFPRTGEKIHEQLIGNDELKRVHGHTFNYFLLNSCDPACDSTISYDMEGIKSSKNSIIKYNDLKEMLETNDYYMK